jgi:O-antigen chain-terminating methyltransferase
VTGSDPDLDALVAELRARVEQRRRDGLYPGDLEETLDEHFDRLVGSRPAPSPAVYDEIRAALSVLESYVFSRDRIDAASEVPAGELAHRIVGKVVSRQIQGVLEQVQDYSRVVAKTVGLVAEIASVLGREYDTKVLQQLDDLQARVSEQQRALNALAREVGEVRARTPGVVVDAFYDEAAFTAYFRGSTDDLRSRYRDLARGFAGCDPVLEIGFGRGEFLELLREEGIEARGVEVDAHLVSTARGRGLDVELVEGGVECLARLPAASLGGLVMIQVIEHLSPQQVIDVVSLAAEKVRPGGRVVFETVNPMSLNTYARAFWVDPDHVRPVHPAFLEFLFREAGFRTAVIEWRSPMRPDERLQRVAGDDQQAALINANFERLDALLFGPQDYALIATR